MDDEKLKQRLERTTLSSPGISLAQVRERMAPERPRRPSGLARLAMAAAAVWMLALATQLCVERSLPAVAPLSSAVTVAGGGDETGGEMWAYAQQRELLQELIAERQPVPLPDPPRPRESADDRRSSMAHPRARWLSHVS